MDTYIEEYDKAIAKRARMRAELLRRVPVLADELRAYFRTEHDLLILTAGHVEQRVKTIQDLVDRLSESTGMSIVNSRVSAVFARANRDREDAPARRHAQGREPQRSWRGATLLPSRLRRRMRACREARS